MSSIPGALLDPKENHESPDDFDSDTSAFCRAAATAAFHSGEAGLIESVSIPANLAKDPTKDVSLVPSDRSSIAGASTKRKPWRTLITASIATSDKALAARGGTPLCRAIVRESRATDGDVPGSSSEILSASGAMLSNRGSPNNALKTARSSTRNSAYWLASWLSPVKTIAGLTRWGTLGSYSREPTSLISKYIFAPLHTAQPINTAFAGP
mmetsp:Transcript_60497/g.112319  ORF Transcript_60497/g.112319 Transcript_60497/m.112319 type:complete len:211 (-) Transcript_60497:212-844(-)